MNFISIILRKVSVVTQERLSRNNERKILKLLSTLQVVRGAKVLFTRSLKELSFELNDSKSGFFLSELFKMCSCDVPEMIDLTDSRTSNWKSIHKLSASNFVIRFGISEYLSVKRIMSFPIFSPPRINFN